MGQPGLIAVSQFNLRWLWLAFDEFDEQRVNHSPDASRHALVSKSLPPQSQWPLLPLGIVTPSLSLSSKLWDLICQNSRVKSHHLDLVLCYHDNARLWLSLRLPRELGTWQADMKFRSTCLRSALEQGKLQHRFNGPPLQDRHKRRCEKSGFEQGFLNKGQVPAWPSFNCQWRPMLASIHYSLSVNYPSGAKDFPKVSSEGYCL